MIRAADGKDNLHVLLPMVCSTDEVTLFSVLLDDACAQLISEGMEVSRPKMGVMIEVPAAISMLPFWQDKIDFISIGSNDLSQYLLAMDRNNARVSKRYDHVHPAVIHEIFRIVQSASTLGLPVSVCGEMAADPVAVILLIGMGVRSLSLSSAKLPKIKWMIRSLSVDQARRVLSKALTYDDVERIRQLGNKTLISIGLEELAH
jgi:phosphotransferase system enzyme I (PtsI)/phosphotransferase system enzyme I (PtsP)